MIRLEPRLTIRVRLTLWYSGLFLASGTALLAVTYGLLVQAFRGNPAPTAAWIPGSVKMFETQQPMAARTSRIPKLSWIQKGSIEIAARGNAMALSLPDPSGERRLGRLTDR